MHIGDGILDWRTAAATGILAAAGLGYALRRAKATLPPRRVPLMGLSAAFVFAAQMLNFPVVAGTSGHLMGGVLTATLLGPSAAVVVLSAVLIVQCFMFGDGGVTALGANIFNIGIISSVCGYAIYRLVHPHIDGLRGRIVGAAFAAWCTTVLAATCAAGQIALSGHVSWTAAFTAMAGVHMLIGIGEGLITALVLAGIAQARPELLETGDSAYLPRKRVFVAYGLLVSLGLAMFVSPLASEWPDGLEFVAEKLHFAHHDTGHALPAPIPEYQLPGIGSAGLATALAGAVGTLVVFGLSLLLARVLVPAKEVEPQTAART